MSMSIEKALDKIADVLTNTTDDSNGSIEYSLSVIANALANGGAKELPEVTATDNGDVLTVVEGAWAKAAPSGGGASVIECSLAEIGGAISLNTPYADIKRMYENGVMPTVRFTQGAIVIFHNCVYFMKRNDESFRIEARSSMYSSGDEPIVEENVVQISVLPDDTATVSNPAYYFSVTEDE